MSEHAVEQKESVASDLRKRTERKQKVVKEPARNRLRTFIKTRRDQASVLWGGPTCKRVIARFSKRGVCRTRSGAVADYLLAKGYQEVLPGQQIVPTPWAEPDPRYLKALEMELSDTEGLSPEDPSLDEMVTELLNG